MRRITIAVILAMAVATFAAVAVSDTDAAGGTYFDDPDTGFRYKVVDGTEYGIKHAVELVNPGSTGARNVPDSSYTGTPTVPSAVEHDRTTYSVIGLSDRAFFHSDISGITLSEGLRYIDHSTFDNTPNLTSIKIPASVERIGSKAAFNYMSIAPVFTHSKADSAITDLTFEEGSKLKYIGNGALSGVLDKNITIPAGVTDLGVCGEDSPKLGSTSICSLNGYAYAKNISFATGSPFSIEDGAIYKNGTELYYALDRNITSLTIKDGVTHIGENSLRGCDGLTDLTIPSTVESIGNLAFNNCSSLESIVIPSSVRSIGDYAFYGCIGLAEIILSEGLETIGDYAFYTTFPTSVP